MAQTQIREKLLQVFVTEETSQDTYIAPAAGYGFLAEDVTFAVDSSNWEPNYMRSDGFSMDEVPGLRSATISCRVPLKYSGTAGTAPETDEALKACGLEVTNTPATSDVYAPIMTFDGAGGNPGPSYTVSIIRGAFQYSAIGAFGNVSFSAEVGQPMYAEFTFQGAYYAPAADAFETISYDTSVAPVFMGATASITCGGAYTPIGVTAFSLDLGNNVVLGRCAQKTYGHYGARITSRKSTGSITCELDMANKDFLALQAAGTSAVFTTGAVGPSAGNRWTLAVARSILRPITIGAADGIVTTEIPFAVSSVSTDVEGTNDDITLSFT